MNNDKNDIDQKFNLYFDIKSFIVKLNFHKIESFCRAILQNCYFSCSNQKCKYAYQFCNFLLPSFLGVMPKSAFQHFVKNLALIKSAKVAICPILFHFLEVIFCVSSVLLKYCHSFHFEFYCHTQCQGLENKTYRSI